MKTLIASLIQADKTIGNRFATALKILYGIWAFWMFYVGLFQFQDQHTEILANFWPKVGAKYGFEGMKLVYVFIIKYVCLALGAISFLLIPLRKFWHLTALWFLSFVLAVVP